MEGENAVTLYDKTISGNNFGPNVGYGVVILPMSKTSGGTPLIPVIMYPNLVPQIQGNTYPNLTGYAVNIYLTRGDSYNATLSIVPNIPVDDDKPRDPF